MVARLSTVVAIVSTLIGAAFAQSAAKLTDSQIALIAYTAVQVDMEGARQAMAKSTNKDVRAFAENMVLGYTAASKQTLDLVHKLQSTPEENDISQALTEQAADKRSELSRLSGVEFDKAYIANEVAYQQMINGALEITLIPSATNPELKRLMQTSLKIFRNHHQHAKEAAFALK